MFEVYDNHGITLDRYTIYLLQNVGGGAEFPTWEYSGEAITTDGDPSNFWQHLQFDPSYVGKNEQRIDVTELPAKAQTALLKELQGEE